MKVVSWGPEKAYKYAGTNFVELHFQTEAGVKRLNNFSNNLDYSNFLVKTLSSYGVSQLQTILDKGMRRQTNIEEADDYDLIVLNNSYSNGLPKYVSKRFKIPLVIRFDWIGLPYMTSNFKSWVRFVKEWTPIIPSVYNFEDKIITVLQAKISQPFNTAYTHSKHDAEKIKPYVTNKKIEYFYPFVPEPYDSGISAVSKRYGKILSGKYVLFYSGRDAGTYLSIRYIYLLAKRYEKINFVISGNFANESKIYTLPNLTFLGLVPQEDLDILLRNSYIVIMPVVSSHGIQIKLLKALAYGKTILATKALVYPIDDIISNYHNIIINDKPDEFMKDLDYVYSDEHLVASISKGAFKLYKENFHPINNYRRLENFFRNCARDL
ncbi:MAG: glycosyltransferase [Candidatus Parvarchaeota archaeon]